MKTKKTETVTTPYLVSVSVGTETYSGKGETILEALEAIEAPVKLFLKGVVTVDHGDKHKEFAFPPVRIKRLFYPLTQPYLAKQLTYLMKWTQTLPSLLRERLMSFEW